MKRMRKGAVLWLSLIILLAVLLVIGIALRDWQSDFGSADPLGPKAAKPSAEGAPARLEGEEDSLKHSADPAAPAADAVSDQSSATAPHGNPALKRNEPLTVGGKADEGSIRLSGVVLDTHTKQPLEGVLVRISSVGDGASRKEMQSRQEGTFSLAVRPAPRYEVRATAEGYRGYSQTGLVADSSRSDLLVELTPHWEISGIVLDEKSRPVEGAAVWVRTAKQSTRQAVASSRTDASGRFVLEGWIGAGSYLVGASHLRQRPGRLPSLSAVPAMIRLRSNGDTATSNTVPTCG